MTFWRPAKTKKKEPRPPDSGQAVRAKKKRKKYNRSTPISFEAEVLALEALNCGADRQLHEHHRRSVAHGSLGGS